MLLKLGFLKPKSVEKVISLGDGSAYPLQFFPFRYAMVTELLSLSRPISKALVSLFEGKNDRHSKTMVMDEGENHITQIDQTPPDPSLMRLRLEQKHAAVDELVDALVGPRSNRLLSRMVVDSLRQEFPRGTAPTEIEKFFEEVSFDQLIVLVSGAMEANAEVIRPFLAKAGLSWQDHIEPAVQAHLRKLRGLGESPESPEPSTTKSPELSVT